MPLENVADSTDWLSTPLSGLAAVEAALRCQVCKDLYKTPMMTSCSHTFCSLCIRRALSNDGKCPLCRAPEQELKLRSNWSVEEAAEAFSRARSAALNLATNALPTVSSPKRRADDREPLVSHPKRLRTSARLGKAHAEALGAPAAPQPEEHIVEATDSDDDYVPDNPDSLVPCPSCQREMKAWQVFQHLESCPGLSRPGNGSNRSDSAVAPVPGQCQRRQNKSLERLPPLNYSMLKEQALRKKMTELGISSQGPRSLLEKRHKEWLTLWNANCDAAQPKRRSELLQDLDVWERTQGGRAPTTGRTIQAATAIKDKDFDGEAWAAKHNASFRDLVASARRSRMEATKKAEEGSSQPATVVRPAGVETALSDAESSSLLSPLKLQEDTQGGPGTAEPPAGSTTLKPGSASNGSPDAGGTEPTCTAGDALDVASPWQQEQQARPLQWDDLGEAGPPQQPTALLDPDR